MEALQNEISDLKDRIEELSFENEALRHLCSAHGIGYVECLATKHHKRYFARLCAEHPIEEVATASDALCILPIQPYTPQPMSCLAELVAWDVGRERWWGLFSQQTGSGLSFLVRSILTADTP